MQAQSDLSEKRFSWKPEETKEAKVKKTKTNNRYDVHMGFTGNGINN